MVMPRRGRMEAVDRSGSVTTLELFFDLVFVFALTEVTGWMAHGEGAPTGENVLRGALIVIVLWWTWVGWAWLCNIVKADEGVVRVGMFLAMAVMFVAALTIPEAFVDLPGGLYGPAVFAACYFGVRTIHMGMFWLASRDDPQLRSQLVRFAVPTAWGTVMLLVASQTEGVTQTVLWIVALLGDLVGTLVSGDQWRLRAPGHFAERHGLIVIVALGESIVSIGVGVVDLPVSWPIVAASALGLAAVGALWWAYFDVTAMVAERALAAAEGEEQVRLARGGYSFLHLPMIVGIVMMALGLKKAMNYIAGHDGHELTDPLYGVSLVALYGGTALYLAGHIGFKWYLTRQVSVARVVTVALLILLIPVAWFLPAMASLALLAVLLCAMIAVETHRFREVRHAIRHEEHHG
ncbi:MAG: low temperature requirement protein A [Pseudonocardia sp.]